jgi:hypothetical protein
MAEEEIPTIPVDVNRGRAVLQAYGAYAPGHDPVFEVLRVLSEVCAVLAEDMPAVDRDEMWAEAKARCDARD